MTGKKSGGDDGEVAAWRAAANDPRITQALEHIYASAAKEIASRSPACWASGRCCNFDRFGHLLYVTGLEAAYTLARATEQKHASNHSLPMLQQDPVTQRVKGPCPYQRDNLCTVHEIKPLGCRVYFCDRSAQEWQQKLSEQSLAEIRSLHEEFNLPYEYNEWRWMLSRFATT